MPLGNPILVKTATQQCSGPCGSQIMLVTDLYRAYATAEADNRTWFGGEVTHFARDGKGDIEAFCPATRGAHECGASAVFTRAMLAGEPWEEAGQRGEWLIGVERV